MHGGREFLLFPGGRFGQRLRHDFEDVQRGSLQYAVRPGGFDGDDAHSMDEREQYAAGRERRVSTTDGLYGAPMTPVLKTPVDFRPMQGLLHIGEKLAQVFGLSGLWAGEDGFEGVLKQKLTEMGVPQKPVPLAGPNSMTTRQMAEASGFIKKPRPQRRVKS